MLIGRLFFTVSTLTIFLSWFLSDGNLVFFSDIILLKFSIFISSFCFSVCSMRFGCVVFRLLLVCSSFQLESSYFLVVSESIIVLGSCCLDSIFTFWCVSNSSWIENQPFFIFVLAWSVSLWLVWNLVHYSQISNILFLYPLCRVVPKITV